VHCRFFSANPAAESKECTNLFKDPTYTTPTLLHPKNRKILQRYATKEEYEHAKANMLKELLTMIQHEEEEEDVHSISSLGKPTYNSLPYLYSLSSIAYR
jgi:hypothetical protein